MTNPNPRPVAFRNLPESAFPFTIEFYKDSTKEVVHTIEVTGPGVVHVPRIAYQVGQPCGVRVTYADGSVVNQGPQEY